MEFVVITRALDSTNLPPAASIALAKQTFQMLASNQDSRIKAMYPFAGERAGIFIVDVKSGDELQELFGSLSFAGITNAEIHPVGSVHSSIKSIERAKKRLANMTPAS